MASPAYEQILEVQSHDLNLVQLRHRHENHPARADVAAGVDEVARIDAEIAALDERKTALDRSLKRLSDEVATIEAKRSGIDAKLYDGTVTASKELLALQHEAASLLERQRGVEDDELELMEQLEVLGAELDQARASRTVAGESLERAEAALGEAVAGLEAEMTTAEAERAAAAAPAAADLLARYEQLAPQYGGVAVARLADGRCDGCHMQLSAVAIDQLNKAPDDAVVTCEECGRLLVR